ncbi:AAEL013706-PA [Aedes aegypti]|uniref:AAEL013706-PA n=1 Tax=Aedes aegypti TaxID=7159 RepID=Q16ID6_AEDAE|nr:AAEL013706-PA [Aedes aegypti]
MFNHFIIDMQFINNVFLQSTDLLHPITNGRHSSIHSRIPSFSTAITPGYHSDQSVVMNKRATGITLARVLATFLESSADHPIGNSSEAQVSLVAFLLRHCRHVGSPENFTRFSWVLSITPAGNLQASSFVDRSVLLRQFNRCAAIGECYRLFQLQQRKIVVGGNVIVFRMAVDLLNLKQLTTGGMLARTDSHLKICLTRSCTVASSHHPAFGKQRSSAEVGRSNPAQRHLEGNFLNGHFKATNNAATGAQSVPPWSQRVRTTG